MIKNAMSVSKFFFTIFLNLLFLLPHTVEARVQKAAASTYPKNKVTIVGGGIIGALHAYYAYQDARKAGSSVRISMYEKNKSIADTTASHIVPSLTPDEILSVVPRGKELIDTLQILFSEPSGIRVDDVVGLKQSQAAAHFIEQAQIYSKDDAGYQERNKTLLELGKMSMDLWQKIYDDADDEFKAILNLSNFNPCCEPRIAQSQTLHDGYRIDLIFNTAGAYERAVRMKHDYESIGYKNCTILSPDMVMAIDPFLTDFCKHHAQPDNAGILQWRNDAIALWRPGGCFDVQVFLPKFYDYLKKSMGTYVNKVGKTKNCFTLHLDRCVNELVIKNNGIDAAISGVRFSNGSAHYSKSTYKNSFYVLCPGEAVGTLKNLKLKEPAYAGFAGAALMLNISVPKNKIDLYSRYNHYMEVYTKDTAACLAWQARFRNGKIFIGVAGTKAFYGDQRPDKDEAFAKNRNVLQLNIINNVVPEFISLALGRDTQGQLLNESDLDYLECNNIAERWVGTRAVVYDGFPTLGVAYTNDGIKITNACITTHLGSGGVSFAPAAILVSLSSHDAIKRENSLMSAVRTFAQSDRTV